MPSKVQVGRNKSPRARISETLREQITSRRLLVGDHLPPERELAETFGVARATLRKALATLEADGWIETKGRTRRVVRGPNQVTTSQPDSDPLSGAFMIISALNSPEKAAQAPWSEGSYVLTHAAKSLEEAGRVLFFASVENLTKAQQTGLLSMPCAGILAQIPNTPIRKATHDFVTAAYAAGHRPILFGRTETAAYCDMVYPDHEQATYDLTCWLAKQGRRRIACAWLVPTVPDYLETRYRGYVRAIRDCGLELYPPILSDTERGGVMPGLDFAARCDIAESTLKDHFTEPDTALDAILTPSDHVVPAVRLACEKMGYPTHTSVCIAGYDNHWHPGNVGPEHAPPFVTVEKNNLIAAREIARIALLRATGKGPSEPMHVPISCKIIPIT